MEKLIEVFNLGGLPTAPLDSFLELQEDFKKSDPDKLSKLQMLIITRGFKYAFKAWQDPDGKLWIIDAHQRRKALLALRKSGFTIPEIPYEPIFAAEETVETQAAEETQPAVTAEEPQVTEAPQESDPYGGQLVWISETGSKYHNKNNCGRMNPDRAYQMTRENAEAQGYEPCKKCF